MAISSNFNHLSIRTFKVFTGQYGLRTVDLDATQYIKNYLVNSRIQILSSSPLEDLGANKEKVLKCTIKSTKLQFVDVVSGSRVPQKSKPCLPA